MSARGNKRTWPAPWSKLADAAGGVDVLAAMLATSRRQVSRWALEETEPNASAVAMVVAVARVLGVRSPLGDSLEHNRTGVLLPIVTKETLRARMRAAIPAWQKSAGAGAVASARASRRAAGKRWRERTKKARRK